MCAALYRGSVGGRLYRTRNSRLQGLYSSQNPLPGQQLQPISATIEERKDMARDRVLAQHPRHPGRWLTRLRKLRNQTPAPASKRA